MAIAGATETAILSLVFNATAWANYADNAASSPQTNISVALHTADPGTSGTQSTSEVGLESKQDGSTPEAASATTLSTAPGFGPNRTLGRE